MGKPRPSENVCLVIAICFGDTNDVTSLMETLQAHYGPVAEQSQSFPFIHTRYYECEMGQNLQKLFIAFQRFIEPMEIVDIKLTTNELEEKFRTEGKRRVNIDPGYLEVPKLVLATTKNFSHRIYLGQGIYGDVQLFWRQGRFQINPWTYPDYAEKNSLDFFTKIRQKMLKRPECV